MNEYNEYFHRQLQLWGEEIQHDLQSKTIAIISSGGLGSSLGIALGSCGIGTIYCVDFDKVEVHNIHRQIAFKTTTKKPAGIAAPIVMHIASLQANLALRYLAGLPIKKDLLYYLYFNEFGELITQKFNMPMSNHG